MATCSNRQGDYTQLVGRNNAGAGGCAGELEWFISFGSFFFELLLVAVPHLPFYECRRYSDSLEICFPAQSSKPDTHHSGTQQNFQSEPRQWINTPNSQACTQESQNLYGSAAQMELVVAKTMKLTQQNKPWHALAFFTGQRIPKPLCSFDLIILSWTQHGRLGEGSLQVRNSWIRFSKLWSHVAIYTMTSGNVKNLQKQCGRFSK